MLRAENHRVVGCSLLLPINKKIRNKVNSYLPKSEITKDQILKIISSNFGDNGKNPDFISAINNIYKHEDELLSSDKIADKAWLSNGVSLWNMFPGYIDQINCDISNHSYYKFYDSSAGNPGARQALAILENIII